MQEKTYALCLFIFVTKFIFILAVILEQSEQSTLKDEDSLNFNDAFGVCLSKKTYGTFECVNRGALGVLQSLNEKDDLDFGSVRLERAGGQERDLLDLDYDPKDFGNVVKAATRLIERRNMKWNLDNFYPGLQMRVGPMLNGNGVLEFVLNERMASYGDRQAGTGRQLTRHLLLPFLLGFKFNLASLVPLLFGLLLIVTKKALILTKVALFLSGLLGWNSLFSASSNPHPGSFNGFHGLHGYGHEIPIPAGIPYYDHHHYSHLPYRSVQNDDFNSYGTKHVIREVVNVYENEGEAGKRNGKNFAWTKD